MDLKKEMLSKKNWAVIGARTDREKMGYKIPKILRENGYNVYLVNPKYDEIEGAKVYNSILDIEDSIDCVDIIVRPEITLELLDEIREANIDYVWLQPGTFNTEVIDKLREYEIKYVKDCVYAALKDRA